MDTAHLHLVLTHVPVIGVLFAFLVMAYAVLRRHLAYTRLAVVMLIASGLIAIVVLLTGEAAEEAVEGLLYVRESDIEAHESIATLSTGVLLFIAALGGGALMLLRKGYRKGVGATMLILSFIAVLMMGWTANTGGMINHPEVRAEQDRGLNALPHAEDDD